MFFSYPLPPAACKKPDIWYLLLVDAASVFTSFLLLVRCFALQMRSVLLLLTITLCLWGSSHCLHLCETRHHHVVHGQHVKIKQLVNKLAGLLMCKRKEVCLIFLMGSWTMRKLILSKSSWSLIIFSLNKEESKKKVVVSLQIHG